jgi:hypothetical protein
MIRGAGEGAAMGASGEVKAVFLWSWAIDEGAYDTAVSHGWQFPVHSGPPCRFKGLRTGQREAEAWRGGRRGIMPTSGVAVQWYERGNCALL